MKNLYYLFLFILTLTSCSKDSDEPDFTPIKNKFIKITTDSNQPNLKAMHFFNAKTGFVAANKGTIYKTTDAEVWLSLTIDSITNNFEDIFFYDENLGFCVNSAQGVFKYEAETWSTYDFPVNDALLTDLQFLTPNLWYACTKQTNSGFAYLLKTIDAGESWDTLSLLLNADYEKMLMLDENTGFAIGNGNDAVHIIKTTDGGINWQGKISTSIGSYYSGTLQLKEIIAINPENLLVVGRGSNKEQGIILTTNDAGETWNTELPLYALNDVFATDDYIYFAGDNLLVAKWKIFNSGFGNSTQIVSEWKQFDQTKDFLLSNDLNHTVIQYDHINQIQFTDNNVGFILSSESNNIYRIELE